jgi:hypothetical protein
MSNYVVTQCLSGAGGRLAAFVRAAWAIIDPRYHKFAIGPSDTFLSAGRRQRTRGDLTQRQRNMPCDE